jgi:hypothetical protein
MKRALCGFALFSTQQLINVIHLLDGKEFGFDWNTVDARRKAVPADEYEYIT